jgi:translation initiation factor 2B subunit (eIF-2B alpha/beta/delta family)
MFECAIFFRYLMESIDFVFVGAEGVMETGGIINKVRSIRFH